MFGCTASFWLLFDRAEVYAFLSFVNRQMLEQRRGGSLHGQHGILARDAKWFLFYTGGGVNGPLGLARCVVRAIQRQRCAKGCSCFGKTWVGAITLILNYGWPSNRVVSQLRTLRLGLFCSLCCLKIERDFETVGKEINQKTKEFYFL